MNPFLISFLLLFYISCTGVYEGIDGTDTISRNDAVRKIEAAKILRFQACGGDNKIMLADILADFATNPKNVLDGSYYLSKDINKCVKAISLTAGNVILPRCGLSPKEFLKGKPFEGGY